LEDEEMVYVGKMFPTKKSNIWKYNQACHLVADSIDELKKFAVSIGCKIEWFQSGNNNLYSHFDLTKNMREKAVKFGAIEGRNRDIIKAIRNCRK
jgi:hypothetical protein